MVLQFDSIDQLICFYASTLHFLLQLPRQDLRSIPSPVCGRGADPQVSVALTPCKVFVFLTHYLRERVAQVSTAHEP